MSTRTLILALALIAAITALAIRHVVTGPQILDLLTSLLAGGAAGGAAWLFHSNKNPQPDPPAIPPE